MIRKQKKKMAKRKLLQLHSYLVDDKNTFTFQTEPSSHNREITDSITNKALDKITNNPELSLELLLSGQIEEPAVEESDKGLEQALKASLECSSSKPLSKSTEADVSKLMEVSGQDRMVVLEVYEQFGCNFDRSMNKLLEINETI